MALPSGRSADCTAFQAARLVDGHDGRAAEAEVVLQADLRALDLALVGLAAQLPGELGALGQAGGAERMALGDQAAGRVHHPPAAVGRVLGIDELAALALLGQAERLVGDQLVGGEAVVQLDDVDVVRPDARLLVRAAAASLVMSEPTSLIELRSSKVEGMSVTIAWPTISTAWSPRPCSSTKRSLATIARAEPSEVGEHCSLVSGSWIIFASMMSSSEYSSWNCAYGLFTECLWFFQPIQANCSGSVP